jgi:hypothetical protein
MQNWLLGARPPSHAMPPRRARIRQLAHPEDGYQRSVMCLSAWLITNAGAGLCKGCAEVTRSSRLPGRALLPRCGDHPQGGAGQHTLVGCDGSGVTHAGRRAEARPRPAWAGWARWVFPGFPGPAMRISCQTPGRVVAPTSGLSRSAERCRKDARSGSRQVPSPSRVRDSGSLSVFRCRAQNPHRGSMPTPDARPE